VRRGTRGRRPRRSPRSDGVAFASDERVGDLSERVPPRPCAAGTRLWPARRLRDRRGCRRTSTTMPSSAGGACSGVKATATRIRPLRYFA
jgi:hypothetical protein